MKLVSGFASNSDLYKLNHFGLFVNWNGGNICAMVLSNGDEVLRYPGLNGLGHGRVEETRRKTRDLHESSHLVTIGVEPTI